MPGLLDNNFWTEVNAHIQNFSKTHKDVSIDISQLGRGGRLLVRMSDWTAYVFSGIEVRAGDIPDTDVAKDNYWKVILDSLYNSICIRRSQISQNLQLDE